LFSNNSFKKLMFFFFSLQKFSQIGKTIFIVNMTAQRSIAALKCSNASFN